MEGEEGGEGREGKEKGNGERMKGEGKRFARPV